MNNRNSGYSSSGSQQNSGGGYSSSGSHHSGGGYSSSNQGGPSSGGYQSTGGYHASGSNQQVVYSTQAPSTFFYSSPYQRPYYVTPVKDSDVGCCGCFF